MKYTFTTLWNVTFLFVGPFWFMLAWMIWSSGQLQTLSDRMTYLAVVIPGFIVIYLSGFFIEGWHKKKKSNT
ncbi:hypothetical protein [Chlorobium sp.]|uniref:hypothetical protein n=1 Tax=Chlorobium sp. TaxID=1095 RepID=UPI002F3F81A0